ncbi:polysaccharide deacetylase family protein [Sulfurimonas sp.]|uniref:polysaccharide deacetylase family protein n=1 Tax=Sulfurimonas sp. TaxID=2022749 RepID=UPI002609F863|nr:polysaccharide deacetylase family protein [Sulfurimonas sp.]MCW8896106.1 polysaccharide deacetylase family protein [Sulfurimonas sp.]
MLKKENGDKKLLISTMYHNINSDKYSNKLSIFKEHLLYIKNNFNVVFPEDTLKGKDICLTFDDGFYNFYEYVFPLLKELNLKAILAVPTKFILDDTNIQKKDRLAIMHDDTYSHIDQAPFCTFKELKEMSESGHVKIASHSHSHTNLSTCDNLKYELQKSKQILEEKLSIKCDSLIFPYGKYDETVLTMAKKEYKYLFRIGNGINKNFDGINGIIYRINADNLKNEKSIFSYTNMLKYRIKSFIKSF